MYNILVVEDDYEVRDSIREILESNDYRVKLADNGTKALNILDEYLPDVIISDIMMPGLDGMQLLNKLRKKTKYLTIPFIFLTAKTDSTEIREGMNLGADDYITKPFRAYDLLKSIDVRLKKKIEVDSRLEYLKENITQNIPHELRTPLVSIIGYSDLILEGKLDAELELMVSSIKESSHRLYERIEKFILYSDLSKNEIINGKINNSAFFQIGNTYLKEKLLLDNSLKNREDDLIIDMERSDVMISEKHFIFIIEELFNNAAKFSQTGKKIEIKGRNHKNMYRLVVKDNGIGMTPDEISNIDVFRQFKRQKYQQIGNGLGLAIINRIVTLNSSKFEIQSELNKYTEVIIDLPLKENETK